MKDLRIVKMERIQTVYGERLKLLFAQERCVKFQGDDGQWNNDYKRIHTSWYQHMTPELTLARVLRTGDVLSMDVERVSASGFVSEENSSKIMTSISLHGQLIIPPHILIRTPSQGLPASSDSKPTPPPPPATQKSIRSKVAEAQAQPQTDASPSKIDGVPF